jgi:hypothetical protein
LQEAYDDLVENWQKILLISRPDAPARIEAAMVIAASLSPQESRWMRPSAFYRQFESPLVPVAQILGSFARGANFYDATAGDKYAIQVGLNSIRCMK